jgi:hypothetical protein
MARERYPGERRGLSLFLEDLRPVAAERCGRDSLLVHAIRRALRSGDLHHLRHARTLFNHLPRDQRRELSCACVAHTGEPEPPPPAHELLERCSRRAPASFASFESGGDGDASRAPAVSLAHELLPASTVRVMVAPGTLPSAAAGDLRRIAGLIERDRRLLSDRYWRGRRRCWPPAEDDGPPQAPSSSS